MENDDGKNAINTQTYVINKSRIVCAYTRSTFVIHAIQVHITYVYMYTYAPIGRYIMSYRWGKEFIEKKLTSSCKCMI